MTEKMDGISSGTTGTTSSSNNNFMFESYPQQIFIAFVLCLITIVGSIGNIHVILAVLLCRKLRSPTNWLVVNLGMADLITCLFAPFNVVAILSKDGWPVAEWICVMTGFVTVTCLGASISSLALIAHNRWTLLTKSRYTYYRIYSMRNLIVMVIASWVYPLLLVIIPPTAGLNAKLGYSENYKTCLQDTTLSHSNYYSLIGLVCCILPASVDIVIIYVLVYRFVSRHNKAMERGLAESREVTTSCVTCTGFDRSSGCAESQDQMESVDITGSKSPTDIVIAKDSTRPISNLRDTVNHELADSDFAKRQMKSHFPNTIGLDPLDKIDSSVVEVENRASVNENPASSTSMSTKTSSCPVDSRSSSKISHHINVTKRLFSVICFFICFLPFGICVIAPTSDPVVPWGHLLLMINSCINPIIYAGTMPMFRKVMKCILRCRFHSIPDHVNFARFFR